MSIFDNIERFRASLMTASRCRQTARELNALSHELQKDIGWDGNRRRTIHYGRTYWDTYR